MGKVDSKPSTNELSGPVRTVLKLSVCLLFLGMGWLYWMTMAPYTSFFWNDDFMIEPVQKYLGMTWDDYCDHSYPAIVSLQQAVGSIFIAAAVAGWWVRPKGFWVNGVVWAGILLLVPHVLIKWSGKGWNAVVFMKYALLWGTPLLLLLHRRIPLMAWKIIAGIFISLALVGHETFHLLIPVALLIPCRFVRLASLLYAFGWGLWTAIAPTISHITPALAYYGLVPGLAKTFIHLSHGLVPLALFLLLLKISKSAASETNQALAEPAG